MTTQKNVWSTVGIVCLAVIILWMLKAVFNVLLLIFAAALIAIYFHGLAGLIERKLKLPHKLSLPIAIIFSILLLLGFFYFAGSSIQKQTDELSSVLPTAAENFKVKLEQSTIGRKIVEKITSDDTKKTATNVAQSFFRSTFGVLGDIYVVLFLGIFFTAAPKTYVTGAVKLVPAGGKPKAENLIQQLGRSLTKWLKGQIFAMMIVFVLTAIGLVIIGVPMWLVLALLAGLLNFIPNFGPLIAMVPAILIGLMQGTTTALIVAALYILVQVLESNVITPQIQKKLLNIAPALIIISQLIMGVLTGGWGVVLATPILVVVIVTLNELYIKKQKS